MRASSFSLGLIGAAAAAASLATGARRAEACGGCFAPPDAVTAVGSHRMVIALSAERTILWDQILYSGNPKDFVWVLPVPTASATVELADSAFFDELDGQTAPLVGPTPPEPRPCFGCCSSGLADDGLVDDGVIVYNDAVVGPYQTVTIGSQDANALQNWLVENGYRVTEATVPTIAHYVELGSVFVVLRLAPGEGVQSMQPVRVVFPGYMATFPLEMVTVGASGALDLSLWVISEERYEAWNYDNARIDAARLVYDWAQATSNYAEIFLATIEERGGRTWVTEFAGPLDALWAFTERSAADLEQARIGIPYPYVTRLRTRMLIDHLDADLILVPALDAANVPRNLIAGHELNSPFGDDGDGCAMHPSPRGQALLITFLVVGTDLLWRARRRRRARK